MSVVVSLLRGPTPNPGATLPKKGHENAAKTSLMRPSLEVVTPTPNPKGNTFKALPLPASGTFKPLLSFRNTRSVTLNTTFHGRDIEVKLSPAPPMLSTLISSPASKAKTSPP